MKILAFLLFLTGIVFPASSQKDLGETVLWGTRKLEWSDFQGNTTQSRASAESACVIHLEIPGWVGPDQKVRVETLFRKNLSWVRIPSDNLLAHEQGHFNIAELFSRKLRHKIKTGSFSSHNFEDQIMKLFHETNREMEAYQDLYDKETGFSLKEAEQLRWHKKTETELEKLSPVSDPYVHFSVN